VSAERRRAARKQRAAALDADIGWTMRLSALHFPLSREAKLRGFSLCGRMVSKPRAQTMRRENGFVFPSAVAQEGNEFAFRANDPGEAHGQYANGF
jgi:hypothetical protein